MSIRKVAKAMGAKKLSAAVNFSTSLRLNNKSFKIPVIHNMGFENAKVKEDFIFQLFKTVQFSDKGCFLDIGVNVGQTLLKFRSCRDNAYFGFEPNPSCVYYLNNLIETNKMANTTVIPVGLSSASQVAKFYLKSEADTAGTMMNDLRPDYYAQDEVNYVPVFTLDSLDVIGDRKIDLMKIDVEGAESEVLAGMTETIKKHKPAIICEILDSHTEENLPNVQARADKLTQLVKSLDYKIYRIKHNGTQITPEEIEEVKLRKWVPESFNLNDYLFLPKEVAYSDIIKG